MSAQRPIFQDGQRLTAQTLNTAVDFLQNLHRRTQLGPLSPGVAIGYELSVVGDPADAQFRIGPGVAIDRGGRFLVSAAARTFTRAEIEAETGPIGGGERVLVKVQAGVGAPTNDPCAHLHPQMVDDAPEIRLIPRASFVLGRVPAGSPGIDPWSSLELVARRDSELAITLGSVLNAAGGMSSSMAQREGIAPHFDGIRNSFGDSLMELRGPEGEPQVRLTARTFGDDVTATRVGPGAAGYSAGTFAPSDGRVFLMAGGSGPVGAGLAGVAAVPVELAADSEPVNAAGIPLEMGAATVGESAVRARRAGAEAEASVAILGVSAGPSYRVGSTTVVPVATAGLVSAQVQTGPAGLALGDLLKVANGSELSIINDPPATVVARAAQSTSTVSSVVTALVWVSPPQRLSAGIIG